MPKLYSSVRPSGSRKIEEYAGRRRMTAGAEDDRHALGLEPRQAAADIVDFGHHEIEMMELVALAAGDADAVMIGIGKGAKEGDIFADTVGLGEVEHIAEEGECFLVGA
jgi:hypothetical protein